MRPERPRDPEPRSIDVAGAQILYTESGAGRPVVALHGLPATGRVFRWLDAALDERVHLFRPDLPGFGGSAPLDPPPEDPAGYGETVARFCAALDLRDVVVLGHSMGGVAAIDAASRSDRINALALVNSSGPRQHKGNYPRAYRAASWLLDRHRLLERPLLAAIRLLLRRLGFSRRLGEDSLLLAMKLCSRFDPGTLATTLRSLDQPVLVAWSPTDPMVQREVSEGLLALCRRGRSWNVAARSHALPVTHATELADCLVEWMESGEAGVGSSPRTPRG